MSRLSDTLRDFRRKDLRWSYGAVGILILIGVLSNIFFRHGWAVWPFCFAAGAMAMVHEAAERTGQEAKFTAHPATWLNGGRWKDEPAPPPAVGGLSGVLRRLPQDDESVPPPPHNALLGLK